jgi:hypothetical protein
MQVVGAAHGGDAITQATIAYIDGTMATVPLALSDWASSSPVSGDQVAIKMPHRIKAGQGEDGPPVSLFGYRVPLDASRAVQSVTLPQNTNLEVYAATLVAS